MIQAQTRRRSRRPVSTPPSGPRSFAKDGIPDRFDRRLLSGSAAETGGWVGTISPKSDIQGNSYAIWRTSGRNPVPYMTCIIDTWSMKASGFQNAASAPFAFTGPNGATQWEILPTVGPVSTLRASTCTRGGTVRTGRHDIQASTVQGDIDSITHYQTAMVYLDEGSYLSGTPYVRRTIADSINFDD